MKKLLYFLAMRDSDKNTSPRVAILVAYSRGTGKFSQFGREPLPQNVPVIHREHPG